MTPKAPLTWDALVKRQFVVAALAAAVVLGAVVLVNLASARSTRWAVWTALAALVAVAGVLVVLVQHTVRVARFAWREGRR